MPRARTWWPVSVPPMPIDQMAEKFPEAYAQFVEVCHTLEDHYRDMQDMEFTVEHGKLYMLQTRNGKRTAPPL